MPAQVEKIVADNNYLHGQNGDWLSYWEDLGSFCLPRRAWIQSPRSKGERLKFNFLYNSEAIKDAKVCASGFHSRITNPSSIWFTMQTRDTGLMDSREARDWFSQVQKKIYSVLNASNFDNAIQEFYMSSSVFGTGVILIQKDYRMKVRYTFIPIEQLNLAENCYEEVDQVYRNFRFTASQAIALWRDKAGKSVKETYSRKPYEEMEFLHYVGPREIRDYGKDDFKNMEFESIWIAKKDSHLIDELGFKENPYVSGRFWKDSNEVFGFSPAMDVFADVKTINAQSRTALRRAMKETDPPVQIPERGYIMPLNFNPGAITYRKAGVNADALAAIGVGQGNFQITQEMMNMTIQAIKDGFYVGLFQALGDVTKEMTVPEVQKRIADSMSLLGPAVGRHTTEVLTPLLTRTFNILYEMGEFPPIPAILQGREMDFVYLGELVKAQKQSEINPIQSFLSLVGGIAQTKPEVVDKIDTDATVDIIAKILTVDPRLIRDEKQVADIRAARAKAQQEANQLAQAHVLSEAGKNAADAQHSSAKAEAVKK